MGKLSLGTPGFEITQRESRKTACEQLEHYTFRAEARIDADPEGYGKEVYERLVARLLENGTTAASVFGTISVEAK